MSFKVTQLVAYVEIDFEKLFETIVKEYEIEDINDLIMDYIIEYIDQHITFLKGRNTDLIRQVGDGGSINGFEDRDYYRIEEMLTKFIEERN